jgi:8-hydroxy-5-deazaflavin:NADPH oxidoreductase
MKIAIIGGTGKEGSALGARWARAGHSVVLGSRDADRARTRAAELAASGAVDGAGNVEAARAGEVLVLTVPYAAHRDTLLAIREAAQEKVLIDVTVPLRPPAVTRVQLPPGRAAALEAQEILGPRTPVAAALHHVSYLLFTRADAASHCDVLVAADEDRARAVTLALVRDLGLRGLDAGPLANAVALESLTPVLIQLNKRYKSVGVGVVFTDLDETR